MARYEYLGGWKVGDSFFTKGKIYKLIEKKSNDVYVLEDNSFEKLKRGLEVGWFKLSRHFKEV